MESSIVVNMDSTLNFDISGLDKDVVRDLKKKFRVNNPSFDSEAKVSDEDEYSEPKYIQVFELEDDIFKVPRGSATELAEVFDDYDIEMDINDNRLFVPVKPFPKMKFELRHYQQKIIK